MAEIGEKLTEAYSEAVAAALPLHRLAAVAFGFLGAVYVKHAENGSVLGAIGKWPLAELKFEEGGLLSTATIGDMAIGFGLAFAAWIVTLALRKAVFTLISKIVDLKKRMLALIKPTELRGKLREVEKLQQTLEFLDARLKAPRRRLRSLAHGVEIFMGLGIGALVLGVCWGNWIDVVTSVGTLTIALALQVHSVFFYLGNYLGPALIRAAVLGEPLPVLSDALGRAE